MARIDPNDAIQSLSRIGQAAARWMGDMHWRDAVVDPNEELGHIQANLNHIAAMLKEAAK